MTNLERLKSLRIIPGFLVFLVLLYAIISIDNSVANSRRIQYGKRSVEEIMHSPVPNIPAEKWDNEFKSAIIPTEGKK